MAGAAFSGNFSHTLDPKGRAIIPAAFRAALGEKFTIGLNGKFTAVALYPSDRWAAISEELNKIPESDAMGMSYVRLIVGNSFADCELDAQGRVLLPPPLRQKARLQKDIRFVGVGGYFEVWDEEAYQRESAAAEADIDALMRHVNGQYHHHGA
ncbi:MAG: division/cell wall cluster transcriptional repressor MraZ [Clostridiales bacterium]|nr:division/cell wall cluster transcriptional repressor MraZ [Clostridiales bacterium]